MINRSIIDCVLHGTRRDFSTAVPGDKFPVDVWIAMANRTIIAMHAGLSALVFLSRRTTSRLFLKYATVWRKQGSIRRQLGHL